MSEPKTTLSIAITNDIAERLEARVEKTEFESMEEYLEFVVEELDYQLRDSQSSDVTSDSEEVKDRLQSLGYL